MTKLKKLSLVIWTWRGSAGHKFSNPTVTGINNTFWDFEFVGLFYRTRSKLYKNSPTRN